MLGAGYWVPGKKRDKGTEAQSKNRYKVQGTRYKVQGIGLDTRFQVSGK